MRKLARYILLLIMTVGAGTIDSMAADVDSSSTSHDRAIELARNGEFERSLEILGSLRGTAPGDPLLLYDQTVVFAWAGYDAQVLENAKLIDADSAPDYVLAAVARSSRNTADFEAADFWYSTLLARNEANLDARVGLVMSHVDAGQLEEAWSTIVTAPVDQSNTVPLRLAEAYFYEQQGLFMEALASYQRALEVEPTNQAALRGEALVLRTALLPREALALAHENPGILSEEERIQLEVDVAALQIRYGAQSSYPRSSRFEGTDRALTQIDSLLAQPDLDPSVRLRLRYDRVVALSDRLLMADAIAEFESLQVDPADIPPYTLSGAGRAYLHQREPNLARYYLELAVASDPENIEFNFQLFFAYADLQEHQKALELARFLLSNFEPTNQVPGSSVSKGSESYLRATIMVGLAHAYADQLADSQEHFEALLAELPHNTDIRQELANVYRWRGWLDRSLSEYAQVLAVEPEMLTARIGNAHTQLDNRDYIPVEKEVRALSVDLGDEPAVINLYERWRSHNRSELTAEASLGESSGPTFGDDQYQIDTSWFSKPIAHRYRVFVQTHDAFAEFPEGSARRQRAGVGADYRYTRWHASAQLSANRNGGDVGLRGSLDYRFNDFLTLGGVLETESNATPLRGERIGVSSNIASVSAEYAKHESTVLRAQLTAQDFSDGNSALAIFMSGEQRLLNRSRYKMTLVGELFHETRDRDDVVYFSPRNSFSWTTGLRNDWLMYRRYDFALAHGLTARIGQTDQAGYGAAKIWSINYDFRAEINERWSTHIGLSRRSDVYDGTREYGDFILAGFSGRF